MTDEYKLEILNYIVNHTEKTSPNDDEIFLEQQEISKEHWINYLPNSWNNFRYEGMVAGNEATTNLTVLYGGYLDDSDNSHGIITLVDENFMPVKTIYNFNSGTPLRYIQYMKQAEDGTFYYIDDSVFTHTQRQQSLSSEKRFIMTNNFTLINQLTNNYELILRKSYFLTGDYKNFYCKNMFKNPNSSHYVFFGSAADSSSPNYSYRILKIIELKINVGTANEWTMFYNGASTLFGSAIATFQDDNVKFRCLCNSTLLSNHDIDCVSKTFTGTVNRNSIASFSYKPYIDDDNFKKQSVFLDYDNVYFVQNNQHWGISGTQMTKYIGLYRYNFIDGVLKTIYEKNLGNYDFSNIEAIYIDRCDTDIYIQYNNNIDSVNLKADYYFERLENDNWNPKLIGENKYFQYNMRTIYIKSNFNLLQIFLYQTNPRYAAWFPYLIKEDYNALNYNGTSYIDYDSLISKKGQVYSDNKLVFARNLYNRNVYVNSTVSTIQIPNNYLNGINLDLKKLISETNFDMCEDNNDISKNIYEMLFLNYINTISVLDEDTNVVYPATAEYINQNINTGTSTNYNNTGIGKVRINFTTPQIQYINWIWNTDHYECEFTIYTSEIPSSIDFISNDESTIYISKEIELEQNKYYTIKQKLRIE